MKRHGEFDEGWWKEIEDGEDVHRARSEKLLEFILRKLGSLKILSKAVTGSDRHVR